MQPRRLFGLSAFLLPFARLGIDHKQSLLHFRILIFPTTLDSYGLLRAAALCETPPVDL